jgi:hypothetical protein
LSLTPEQKLKLCETIKQDCVGGTVVVGNKTKSAAATITKVEINKSGAGHEVIAKSVFDGQTANFDWMWREIRDRRGNVIDREDADLGRKVEGTKINVDVVIAMP